jgi:hypothetical protein
LCCLPAPIWIALQNHINVSNFKQKNKNILLILINYNNKILIHSKIQNHLKKWHNVWWNHVLYLALETVIKNRRWSRTLQNCVYKKNLQAHHVVRIGEMCHWTGRTCRNNSSVSWMKITCCNAKHNEKKKETKTIHYIRLVINFNDLRIISDSFIEHWAHHTILCDI